MTEAAADSNEDPLEETEDLEPLEPDDGGKKAGPTPALHSCPCPSVLTTNSLGRVPASVSVSPSTRWTGRPGSIMVQGELQLCHVGKAWPWEHLPW